eukprot:Gb_23783 [translate_table: standard]
MHHKKNGRFDIHNVVNLDSKKQPVIKQSQFSVGLYMIASAALQKPANDSPP